MKRHYLSSLVIALLAVLAVGSVDSDKKRSSPENSRPTATPTPPPLRMGPSGIEERAMNRAMMSARAQLTEELDRRGLLGIFIIQDTAHFEDGKVTVNLHYEALTPRANSFIHELSEFDRIYAAEMRKEELRSVTVHRSTKRFGR